tara:strand:- start:848 stop:2077 length:1230 start_codon:yes stop_codon:yes gene_type:complete
VKYLAFFIRVLVCLEVKLKGTPDNIDVHNKRLQEVKTLGWFIASDDMSNTPRNWCVSASQRRTIEGSTEVELLPTEPPQLLFNYVSFVLGTLFFLLLPKALKDEATRITITNSSSKKVTQWMMDSIIGTISVYISHAVGGILVDHNLEDLKDILGGLGIYNNKTYTDLKGESNTYKLLRSIREAKFWEKLGAMETLPNAVVNMIEWLKTKFNRDKILENRVDAIMKKYSSDSINLYQYVEGGGFKDYREIRDNDHYVIDDDFKKSSVAWFILEKGMMDEMNNRNISYNLAYNVARTKQNLVERAGPAAAALLMGFAKQSARGQMPTKSAEEEAWYKNHGYYPLSSSSQYRAEDEYNYNDYAPGRYPFSSSSGRYRDAEDEYNDDYPDPYPEPYPYPDRNRSLNRSEWRE